MAVHITIFDAAGGGYVIIPRVLPSEAEARALSRELRKAGLPPPHYVACAPPANGPAVEENEDGGETEGREGSATVEPGVLRFSPECLPTWREAERPGTETPCRPGRKISVPLWRSRVPGAGYPE